MSQSFKCVLSRILIGVFLVAQLMSAQVQAAMVPTSTVIQSQGQSYSPSDLQTALESEELQQQLLDMGVDPAQLSDRISAMTPAEIQQLNAELAEQPAGGSILGILLVVFVVFVITDMLCATDLFGFVKCINK